MHTTGDLKKRVPLVCEYDGFRGTLITFKSLWILLNNVRGGNTKGTVLPNTSYKYYINIPQLGLKDNIKIIEE